MKGDLQISTMKELRTWLFVDPPRLWPTVENVARGTHPHFGRQEVLSQVKAARIDLAACVFPAAAKDILERGDEALRDYLQALLAARSSREHDKFRLYDEFEERLLTDDCGCAILPEYGYEIVVGPLNIWVRPACRNDIPMVAKLLEQVEPHEKQSFPWSSATGDTRVLREGFRLATEDFSPLIALDWDGNPIGFCIITRDSQFPRLGNIVSTVLAKFEGTGIREEMLKIVLTHVERARFPKLITRLANVQQYAIDAYKALRFNLTAEIDGGRCDGLGGLESMLILARDVE